MKGVKCDFRARVEKILTQLDIKYKMRVVIGRTFIGSNIKFQGLRIRGVRALTLALQQEFPGHEIRVKNPGYKKGRHAHKDLSGLTIFVYDFECRKHVAVGIEAFKNGDMPWPPEYTEAEIARELYECHA